MAVDPAPKPRVIPERRFPSPFENFLSPHPKLVVAARSLARIACNPTGQDIVFVVGPTGVGKDALLDYTALILRESFASEMQANSHMQPSITVLLRSVPSQGFKWGVYYQAALRAAKADLRLKMHLPPWRIEESGADRYGTAYFDMLKAVDARLVMANEGAELAKVGSDRMLFRNVDQFKILTEASGIPHAIVGEYRVLGLVNINGQQSRRTTVIHFQRYGESAEDVLFFTKAVRRFTAILGRSARVDVDSCIEFMRERSVGCIGIVCNWLHKAFVEAVKSGLILDCSVIHKTAPSAQQAALWRDEALMGEALYAHLFGSDVDPRPTEHLIDAVTGRFPKKVPMEISVRALGEMMDRIRREASRGH